MVIPGRMYPSIGVTIAEERHLAERRIDHLGQDEGAGLELAIFLLRCFDELTGKKGTDSEVSPRKIMTELRVER